MTTVGTVIAVEFALGAVGAAAMLYLLYSETLVVAYDRFFRVVAVGLLVFALTGPAFQLFAPALLHAVHGLAGLFVTVGLYDLVARELGQGRGVAGGMERPDDDVGFGDLD